MRVIWIITLALFFNSAHAETWSVKLSSPSGWGFGPGIQLNSDGEMIINRGPQKLRHCRAFPIADILHETEEIISRLPDELTNYNHIQYRNLCMDNRHTVMAIQHGNFNITIDYVEPDCSNNAIVPASILELAQHLRKLIAEFQNCEAKVLENDA